MRILKMKPGEIVVAELGPNPRDSAIRRQLEFWRGEVIRLGAQDSGGVVVRRDIDGNVVIAAGPHSRPKR